MERFELQFTPAPLALAPALRLVQPVVLERPQEPLLPWPPAAEVPTPAEDEIPPELHRTVSRLAAGVVEVLRGRRPLDHLAAHTVPGVLDLLGQLRQTRSLPELRLASLRLSRPATDAVEAAARLQLGARSRAAALRVTAGAEGWQVSHLELALEDAEVLRSA